VRAKLDRAETDIALLREELAIKDSRWRRTHTRRRPHFTRSSGCASSSSAPLAAGRLRRPPRVSARLTNCPRLDGTPRRAGSEAPRSRRPSRQPLPGLRTPSRPPVEGHFRPWGADGRASRRTNGQDGFRRWTRRQGRRIPGHGSRRVPTVICLRIETKEDLMTRSKKFIRGRSSPRCWSGLRCRRLPTRCCAGTRWPRK